MGMLAAVKLASTLTGLTERTILTHFVAETGGSWPENNNPANILYFGDVHTFGEDERRFPWYAGASLPAEPLADGAYIVAYPSVDAGIRAYAALLNADYGYILEAAKVEWLPVHPMGGDMLSGEMAALVALGASPWDGAHYAATMGPGSKLFADFPRASEILSQLEADEAAAKTPAENPTAPAEPKTYTVEPGDSLWTIAVREYGNGEKFREIATANGLTFPYVIHPGDVLKLPTL